MHVDPWLRFKRRIGEDEYQSAQVGEVSALLLDADGRVKRRKDKERQGD